MNSFIAFIFILFLSLPLQSGSSGKPYRFKLNPKSKIINALSMVESGGGKYTSHALLPEDGPHKGSKAIGSLAITPLLIHYVVKSRPHLQKYKKVLKFSLKNTHLFLNKNPELETLVINEYYNELNKEFSGNAYKISLAWLKGKTGAINYIKNNPKSWRKHWYIQKFDSFYNNSIKLASK